MEASYRDREVRTREHLDIQNLNKVTYHERRIIKAGRR